MNIPIGYNCEHIKDGYCLKCVNGIMAHLELVYRERDDFKSTIDRLIKICETRVGDYCLNAGHNHKNRIEEMICSISFQNDELRRKDSCFGCANFGPHPIDVDACCECSRRLRGDNYFNPAPNWF